MTTRLVRVIDSAVSDSMVAASIGTALSRPFA